MNLNDLKRPFPPDVVKWRVGSTNKEKTRGMALAYIDARDVMDRLDEVCGPEHWSSGFAEAAGRVICTISIRCLMPYPDPLGQDDSRQCYGWVHKADGAGDTDFEAEKGGISAAFKRAAVQWGIGRYLYDIPATWVAIEAMGKSFRIADSEMPNLRRLLAGNAPSASHEPQAGDVPSDERERFLARLRAIESIDGLATLYAWLAKHGEKRFGDGVPELAAAIQARLEVLRAAK